MKIKKIVTVFCVVLFSVAITSCASKADRRTDKSVDYKDVRTIPALKIPNSSTN